MIKRVIIYLNILFFIFTLTNGFCGDHPSRKEVEKFVQEAKAYVLKHGRKKFLAEVVKPEGQFIRGELYLAIYTNDNIVLAHGVKPYLKGKDLSHLKDKNGLNLAEEYHKALDSGKGWIEYYWENPVTKKIQKKLGYVVRVNNEFIIQSGTYAEE